MTLSSSVLLLICKFKILIAMSTWIEFVLVPDLTHKGNITVFALTLQLPTSDYYLFSPLATTHFLVN